MPLTKEEIVAKILKRWPRPPNEAKRLAAEAARAKLTVASENELSLETQQERLAVQARRLFEEQKRAVEDHNRALIYQRRQATLCPPPLSSADRYEAVVGGWAEMQRDAGMYERKLRRQLDPCGLGIYGVERFHGSEGDE